MLPQTICQSEAQWEQVQEVVAGMEEYVCQAVGRQELHEVEGGLFRRLQQLGRVMLERFVAASGTGYTPCQPPCTMGGEPLTYKGIEAVNYLSIFGEIDLPRAAYGRPDRGDAYPMDAQWNRPAHKHSYLLQKWLLRGQVGRVIGGFRQRLTKGTLTRAQKKAQKKALNKAITHFDNHRHMMDYTTYLAKGYPIGTGLIEGACGYLVKQRMEGSGRRWSRVGAEAMLQQRAVKLNGDWDDFWSFHTDSERDRLYPATYQAAA